MKCITIITTGDRVEFQSWPLAKETSFLYYFTWYNDPGQPWGLGILCEWDRPFETEYWIYYDSKKRRIFNRRSL